MECLQSAEISRIFNHDLVTRVYHDCREHIKRLLAAVCNNDILRAEIKTHYFLISVADEFYQRRIALCAGILQCPDTVSCKDFVCSGIHFLHREGHGVGKAACERDKAGVCSCFKYVCGKSPLEVRLRHSF